MVLCPNFSITQDDDYVYVRINVPYIRVSDAESIVEGNDFTFYCKPYLLKLTFPGELDGNNEETCRAAYDPFTDNGTIIANLPKVVKGQYFQDLDLITSLLQKRIMKDNHASASPVIEVLSSSDNVHNTDIDTSSEDVDAIDYYRDMIDNELLQSTQDHLRRINLDSVKYGFNNSYSNVFGSILEDNILELKENPDVISHHRRRDLRLLAEKSCFSPERYLGDYFHCESDMLYLDSIEYEAFWNSAWNNRPKKATSINVNASSESTQHDLETVAFNSVDYKTMLSLPNKEYLVNSDSTEGSRLLAGMIDILFAYCYDHRLTQGEHNVESPHNISRLSATLSWLEYYDDVVSDSTDAKINRDSENATNILYESVDGQTAAVLSQVKLLELIKISCKRSVIYPYLRHWIFTRKILADVAKVLFLGRRCILKCFLHLHRIFEHSDQHYILNKLFITDYCVWLQSVNNAKDSCLHEVAVSFNEAKRSVENSSNHGKDLLHLKLSELETWAVNYLQSQEDVDDDEECNDILPDIPAELIVQ